MGGKIDESLPFHPMKIAILTISDTRDLSEDTSGDTLVQRLTDAGHELADRALVTDDIGEIREQVKTWAQNDDVQVVISTGGTGLTGRDVTPEAFKSLYDKEIEGFSVIFHQISFESVGTSTIQSRATAGICGNTLLFALPGSTGAVKDGWDGILQYQLDSRHRPCNFVEIMPRLTEGQPD